MRCLPQHPAGGQACAPRYRNLKNDSLVALGFGVVRESYGNARFRRSCKNRQARPGKLVVLLSLRQRGGGLRLNCRPGCRNSESDKLGRGNVYFQVDDMRPIIFLGGTAHRGEANGVFVGGNRNDVACLRSDLHIRWQTGRLKHKENLLVSLGSAVGNNGNGDACGARGNLIGAIVGKIARAGSNVRVRPRCRNSEIV